MINIIKESLSALGNIGTISLIFGINFTKRPKSKNSEFEVEPEEYASNIRHLDQIEKLKRLKESPETLLEVLDVIAQDFLKKKFHIRKAIEYSDLIEFFTAKNKPQIIDFCRRMNEALYSGQTLTGGNIEDLITDLESIILKEDPGHNEYESKKDPKLYSLIDKISLFETKKEKAVKEEYLGKKTKALINSKLSKKKDPLEKQSISVPIQNNNYNTPAAGGSNTALDLLNSEEGAPEVEPEEDKLIESIDDLDRIREKIQQRKKNPAENAQENYN